jgi:2-oxoisovalerate dehydrogenase E1 component alpha subunit
MMNLTWKSQATFEVLYTRFLNEQGKPEQTLPDFVTKDIPHLIALYTMMVRVRHFDKKAVALQRTGLLSTFPATTGQEAISVGIGAAMLPEDVLCPYYREYGAQFWRGVTMEEILLYWGGDEQGSNFQHPTARQDFPICVPIGSQTLYATGVATAFKLKRESRVCVATIGEGGTSRGDFYEAINIAGVWNLPIVFVVNNNQWAISVPSKEQTHCQTYAQKAIAGGVKGIQIDGNDVITVRETVHQAIEQARNLKGPTVIEAITYRMCDHTTADDASRYQPKEEVEAQKNKDPILRLRTYLHEAGLWNEEKEKNLYKTIQDEVNMAAENYLSIMPREAKTMFDHLYHTLPVIYQDQLDEIVEGA